MFDIVKLKNREIRQENGEQFGNMAENRFMRLTISKTCLTLLTISKNLS
mgnify:FL=1